MTKNPQLFKINGRVIDRQTGKGINSLRVEARDWELIINDKDHDT